MNEVTEVPHLYLAEDGVEAVEKHTFEGNCKCKVCKTAPKASLIVVVN